jgi:hypothetical protein
MAEFESFDLSEMQSEYARLNADQASNSDYLDKFVKMPQNEGFTVVRILPPKKGEKLPYCATRVHNLKNPTTGRSRSYHCHRTLQRTSKGDKWYGDCIVCKVYSDLWEQSESCKDPQEKKRKQDQARTLKPVERFYYNVIVRSEKDKDNNILKNVGPKIYSCGKTVQTKIVGAFVGDESAGEPALGDITNISNGRDFRIIKKMKKSSDGDYPDYALSKFEDQSPAGTKEEIEKWVQELNDLQALRQLKDKDELKHALLVHLGRKKEGGEDQVDEDLKEFREPCNVVNTTSNTVREELVTSSVEEEESVDDDIMADDDFMKGLM